MIVEYSVRNFGSIKDKQTLSFEASSSDHLEDSYIIKVNDNLRLLKLGLIYGANASGKTTLLKSIDFLRGMIISPLTTKNEKLDFKPFLFDAHTPYESSEIEVKFIQNDKLYFYCVEFNQLSILKEELYHYNPTKACVYKRTTDSDKELAIISFGSRMKFNKELQKGLELNTLWNNTLLGGFLKTNGDAPILKEIIEWFRDYLKPFVDTRTNLDGFVTTSIDQNTMDKVGILQILKQADLNISDIIIHKEESKIPTKLLELIKVGATDESKEFLEQLKHKGTFEAVELKVEHNVGAMKYTLPFEDESEGTKRYYGFAGLLSLLINQSTLVIIDELESSLHPDLYTHFLKSFVTNTSKSQLLATTHYRELLSERGLFRNDAIWFTDKSEEAATELYSLDDFDTSVIRATSSVYNAYKTGKLGGKPNTLDHFIDIDYGTKEE